MGRCWVDGRCPCAGCIPGPVLAASLDPLLRWQQLEALKEEKLLQLTRGMEVYSLLHESEPTQAQLLSMISRLEALGTRSPGDSHHTLQQTQQDVLVLEKKISYLQRATIEYGQLQDGDGGGETVRTERSSNKMRRAQELGSGDGQDMLLEGCGQQPDCCHENVLS